MDIEELKKLAEAAVCNNGGRHFAAEIMRLKRELANEKIESATLRHGYRLASDNCVRLERELEDARRDAERLEWVGMSLFESSWNGVIDSGSKTHWRVRGDHRHTAQRMVGESFAAAIDAARNQKV